MMKKLLLLSSALFTLSFGAVAQTVVVTPLGTVVTTPAGVTYTTVIDTLEYFLNKQQFKTGKTLPH